MERKPNKCRYVEGNQSALKTFAMRVFGRIHENRAQKQIRAAAAEEEKANNPLPKYVEGDQGNAEN